MSQEEKWFWITLALVTGLRLFAIAGFELAPDEAYYWTWSRHLDWGYYDQGPLLALVIRLGTWLGGGPSAWSVRLGSVLLSGVTSWFFFQLVRRATASNRAAWYAFLLLQSALLISAGALLMMHDSIMVCAWTAALYFFHRALCQEWRPGWVGGALALGAGALAKYSMALFVPCLLLFLVVSPRQRREWLRPPLYLAGVATLLLVAPLVIWNLQHGWASFGHIGDLSGAGQAWKFSLSTVGNYLGGQLGIMSPLLGALCFAAPLLAWRLWRQGQPHGEDYLFLACFSAPIFLFFLVLSVRTSVYANWPAPAYPAALAILGGVYAFRQQRTPSRAWRSWAWATLALSLLFTLVAHTEVLWGVPPLTGRAAESMDRVRGWRIMGNEASRLLRELQAQSPTPLLLGARRYQIAGLLSFYTEGHPEVQLFPLREPADNQYRFWDQRSRLAGRNFLYVSEHYWEADHIRPFFNEVRTLEPFAVIQNGRKIREIRYFLALGYNPSAAPAGAKP
ncbi:MAG: glycosyltransferase family 39 protein [candidate division FCPU426 bacterium]